MELIGLLYVLVIPNTENDFSIMLDLGANVSVDSKNLLQFAVMGYCYHSNFKKEC